MSIKKAQLIIKYLIDMIAGVLLLLISTPLLFLIMILVRLTSPGPAFFLQTRPGLHGKPFRIYKFRTMYMGSERMEKGKEVTLKDPRITLFGQFLRRTKIDELPQLINVMKGEMSLIGPRPERMESVIDYSEITKKRFEMKPGITGLAQVCGNIYLPIEDRYLLDVFYVTNFSLLLDIGIFIKTIGVILYGEDKYVKNISKLGQNRFCNKDIL